MWGHTEVDERPPAPEPAVRPDGEHARARRRAVVLWATTGVLLVLAFAAAVGAVQRAFYSPSGFVTAYVQSLAGRDVSAALAMPGAAPTDAALEKAGLPVKASRELLRSDLLPALRGVRVDSDTELSPGRHRVTVSAAIGDRSVTSSFTVEQSGSVLGVLPTWRFATSPLTVARVTVAHADAFTVGRHTVYPRAASPDQPPTAFSVSADYVMFAPARYELGHRSEYLAAGPTAATGKPGQVVEVTVDAEPTPAFTKAVQKELDGFLDKCATQQVLQPAGCPFGVEIDDRVQGVPSWSIGEYPEVHLAPGPTAWTMGQAVGVADLSVTVQSLFDGSVEQRKTGERFAVSLSSVTIRPDGSLDIVVGD